MTNPEQASETSQTPSQNPKPYLPCVSFVTPGHFDVETALMLGVSVKPTSTTPIGLFGTGLKYAIAQLLRTEHSVSIEQGDTVWLFTTEPMTFRGESLQQIILHKIKANGSATLSKLGFTTDLGHHWTHEMAFRELHSNTLDEGGTTSEGKVSAKPDETRIFVRGTAFHEAWQNRKQTFTEAEQITTTPGLSVRNGSDTSKIFLRGVAVHDLRKPTLFTYDFKRKLELTEDRTLRWWYEVPSLLANELAFCDNEAVLKAVLTAPEGVYEHTLPWTDIGSAGPVFKSVLVSLIDSNFLVLSARLWAEKTNLVAKTPWELSQLQHKMLKRAEAFLLTHVEGYHTRFPKRFVKLPAHTHAQALEGEILLSPLAFSCGTKWLAHALLEEWIHMELGLEDCTRNLQTHLFQALLSAFETAAGEPL